MNNESTFIERRKEYRLPYGEKIIFTDGTRSMTAYAANVSRGGVFVKTLSPFPIDTTGYLAFTLANQPNALVVQAKVAHLVFDRQRCEVECGMGLQFLELAKSHSSALNLHIHNEQSAYLELKELLKSDRPNAAQVVKVLQRLPYISERDLLGLRYRANRICTLFENASGDHGNLHPLSA